MIDADEYVDVNSGDEDENNATLKGLPRYSGKPPIILAAPSSAVKHKSNL